ncbi:MAG: hypothetical protein PVG66_16125, partial [Chromatiales bacterium]
MSEQSRPGRVFRLTRAYSLVSLIGILLVAFVMAYFYRGVAVNALMKVQNESNADLSRIFANSIWDSYADFFARAAQLQPQQLAAQPETASLAAEV